MNRDLTARYELAEALGEGGFARVFRAVQRSTRQSVAIKILQRDAGTQPPAAGFRIARFQREIELCARLHHPHVARLIDAGLCEDGSPYSVFEFVPGRPLDRVLDEEGPLAADEAAHLMGQVLDAIGHAHRHGVLHRDLKPSNVMVCEEGVRRNALVLDFGIGAIAADGRNRELQRLTGADEAIGTPTYASPEQLRGEACSARSDLYSWGLLLLECLTGRPPFSGVSLEVLLHEQLGPDPVRIPDEVRELPLYQVIARATAKRPEERAASAQELMELLQEASPPLFTRASPFAGDADPGRFRLQRLTALSVRVRWLSAAPSLEREEARIRLLHESVAAAVRGRGGSPVGSLGSRVVSLFGYPQAREQAARAALEAAMSLRDRLPGPGDASRQMEIFAGVCSGSMLVPERDEPPSRWSPVTSGIVSGAMELEARAGAYEIWACEETRRLLRGRAILEPVPVVPPDEAATLASGPAPLDAFRLRAGHEALRAPEVSSTPMIGRDAELARIDEAWAMAREGIPRALLVAGEAGIGKSRLVRELRNRGGIVRWIECRCTPESENTPLQPIVEWLAAAARQIPLEARLRTLGLDVARLHPLLAELVGQPFHPDYPPSPTPLQRKRELTLQALLSFLLAEARREPLVLVVEDLHWADPTTEELLYALVRELRSSAIFDAQPGLSLLAILTARPEFEPPWSLSDVPLIQLSRLARPESEALARALALGGAAIPELAIAPLVERSDGVPLFLEEMARMAGESTGTGGAEAILVDQIPATLRDLLNVRIMRIPEDIRTTAQTAACVGRSFDLSLLAAVSGRSEEELREHLEVLAREGLVFRRVSLLPAEHYGFHHVLQSDTARESLLDDTRKDIHLKIARSLSGPPFEEIAATHPERIAFHFEEAGVIDRAIEFRQRAAFRAVARSAHREAIHHYERALELLDWLPQTPERDHEELSLRIATGSAYMMTEGYAAEPAERSFERALALCDRYAEAPRLFSAVNGLWAYNLVRGEAENTPALVRRQQELAANSGSERRLLFADHAAGTTAFLSGRFREAVPLLEEATRRFERASDEVPSRRGAPAWRRQASTAPMYLAWCSHLMGRPERALAHARKGIALAERLEDVDAHVEAATYLVALHHDRREPEQALDLLDRILPLAEEHGLVFWLGIARAARGWARAQLGEVDAGLAEIREGLVAFHRSGALVPLVYRACYLAEALCLAGRAREALDAVDSALTRSRGRLDRFFDAEAFRLRGEILLQMPGARVEDAEDELRRALNLASAQGADLLELRAAASLARHLAASGRREEARSTLAPVRARFSEGLHLMDLQEAQQMLAALEADASP